MLYLGIFFSGLGLAGYTISRLALLPLAEPLFAGSCSVAA